MGGSAGSTTTVGDGVQAPTAMEPGSREPAAAGPIDASLDVQQVARELTALTVAELPEMGLASGLRPAADVDVLLTVVAQAEYEVARRMEAATRAGALPLVGDGAMPLARFWSAGWARRLARAGAFARDFPGIAAPWAAGLITSEHVDVFARRADRLTSVEMAAVIDQLADRWGQHAPSSLSRFVERVIRALHPPPDPDVDEAHAYASRSLDFSVLGDSVLFSGSLPRLEGEVVIAAVDAWAERLRSEADRVPAGARRADALVALVNNAACVDTLPARGGLPVALTITLDRTGAGDSVWTSSRGHSLTPSEERFAACCADMTPVVRSSVPGCASPPGMAGSAAGAGNPAGGLGARVAALAATLLDAHAPLAVGRTQRSATPAQRRALAVRDGGCVIPGCGVPAEACQAHHRVEWSAGGRTDLANLVLVCWAHHRQVDLGMWEIQPGRPDPHRDHKGAPPPGQRWPGNNGSPWTVRVVPRARWRR